MKIYKFIRVFTDDDKKHLRKTVCDSKIWHSAPKFFNDPFDCVAHLVDIENLTLPPIDNSNACLLQSEQSKRDYVDDLIQAGVGVSCFVRSKSSDQPEENPLFNMMMWGLYANKSQGVCLEYDQDILSRSLDLTEVDYQKRPFFLKSSELSDFEKRKKALARKGLSWQNEREIRSIVFDVPNDANGKDVEHDPVALTGIYLGHRFFWGDTTRFSLVKEISTARNNLPIYTVNSGTKEDFSFNWKQYTN